MGVGPIVLKSGGKIISLAPPMTISCYAKLRGKSFQHLVSVSCATVSIPNARDAVLNIKATHAIDVSFKSAKVSVWKLVPPYSELERYMMKLLPSYVREARALTKDTKGVPVVPKKTHKLVKSWKENGISPRVAHHAHWMNPRHTTGMCGTILPDKHRLQREATQVRKRKIAEDNAKMVLQRKNKRADARERREGPSRRYH